MVSSKETTPAAYLASLPPERRKVIAAVRAVVKKNLPKGYVETMNWGMLAYEIPLTRHPSTYNKQPLMYLALAAQKNNYALYLTSASSDKKLMDKQGPGAGFRTELLEGSNNWTAIIKALDDVGYTTADNWATIEMAGGDAERMKKLSGQLDQILAK